MGMPLARESWGGLRPLSTSREGSEAGGGGAQGVGGGAACRLVQAAEAGVAHHRPAGRGVSGVEVRPGIAVAQGFRGSCQHWELLTEDRLAVYNLGSSIGALWGQHGCLHACVPCD